MCRAVLMLLFSPPHDLPQRDHIVMPHLPESQLHFVGDGDLPPKNWSKYYVMIREKNLQKEAGDLKLRLSRNICYIIIMYWVLRVSLFKE